jgi:hypothetical protein
LNPEWTYGVVVLVILQILQGVVVAVLAVAMVVEGLVMRVAHRLQDAATTQDVVAAVASTPNGRNVCLKWTANKCWYRYDEDYVPEQSHTTAAATSSYTVNTNWYTDSGATDHITSELDKLAIRDKYNGAEQVHTASGSGVKISHVGKSFIHTPTRNLKLCNILHVPKVTKKNLCMFIALCWIIMFSLIFTIGSFLVRIRTRGALCLEDNVAMASTPYLHPILISLHLESINRRSPDGMSVLVTLLFK